MGENSVTIVGAGVSGSFLAQRLVKEGYEVTLIDKDSVKLESLEVYPNILTVNCSLPHRECLEYFRGRDYIFFLTDNECLNISSTLLAKKVNPTAKVVARVYTDTYEGTNQLLPNFWVVNMVSKTAEGFLKLVEFPFAEAVWNLDTLHLFKVKASRLEPLIGKPLKELNHLREKLSFAVVLVERENRYFIPSGETVIEKEDTLFVAVESEQLKEFLKTFNLLRERVQRLTVFGYSRYTEKVLEGLGELSVKVKMVEHRKAIIEKLLNKFSDFLEIYEGFPTDGELLKTEGLLETDYLLNLFEEDETNLTLSVFFKNFVPTARVGILLQNPNYETVARTLNVEAYISPKREIAGEIYAYLKGSKISRLAELTEGINIYKVPYQGDRAVEVKNFKGCKFIVAVERNGKLYIPKGDFVLLNGDNLFCLDTV